jgi:hypothetical protein
VDEVEIQANSENQEVQSFQEEINERSRVEGLIKEIEEN